MAAASKPKGPAHDHLESLDAIFGPEYFESGRLVLTVARDLQGLMKVAHKLQSKVNERFGSVVEVIMEHIKHEWWVKLHDCSNAMGLQKGDEVQGLAVTDIPEGIRVHPYKRPQMPSLEVLLLWEDRSGVTRGHCLSTTYYPELPTAADVDRIFTTIEPFFSKRWLTVELKMAPPCKGELGIEDDDLPTGAHEPHVGPGACVTVLAFHAAGFARESHEGVAHVSQCKPMSFDGVTDDAGRLKMCILPAELNKIQVAETDRYHGFETVLRMDQLTPMDQGPTIVPCELTPKALGLISVHIFKLPSVLPSAEDTDGIIDWASEEREPIVDAMVEVTALDNGSEARKMRHTNFGVYVPLAGGLPEGCVCLEVYCEGYEPESRTLMLLYGTNEFYIPMKRMALS